MHGAVSVHGAVLVHGGRFGAPGAKDLLSYTLFARGLCGILSVVLRRQASELVCVVMAGLLKFDVRGAGLLDG